AKVSGLLQGPAYTFRPSHGTLSALRQVVSLLDLVEAHERLAASADHAQHLDLAAVHPRAEGGGLHADLANRVVHGDPQLPADLLDLRGFVGGGHHRGVPALVPRAVAARAVPVAEHPHLLAILVALRFELADQAYPAALVVQAGHAALGADALPQQVLQPGPHLADVGGEVVEVDLVVPRP